jgi:hypothetical protein
MHLSVSLFTRSRTTRSEGDLHVKTILSPIGAIRVSSYFFLEDLLEKS